MTTRTAVRLLTREEILAVEDRASEVVNVPEWGGAVTVRALSGAERDAYEASFVTYRRSDKGGMEIGGMQTANVRARLVSLSLVGPDGERLFKEADLLALGDKNAAPLDAVFKVAQRLSGLSDRDVEVLGTNLKADPNGSSGSD